MRALETLQAQEAHKRKGEGKAQSVAVFVDARVGSSGPSPSRGPGKPVTVEENKGTYIPLELVVHERLLDLTPRRHDERPMLDNLLLERLAPDEDEPRAVRDRLEPDARLALVVRQDRGVVLLD